MSYLLKRRAYRAMEFQTKNVTKEISGSGVIKIFFSGGWGVHVHVPSKSLKHHYSNFFLDIVNLCYMREPV